jgi:hypothetical protein
MADDSLISQEPRKLSGQTAMQDGAGKNSEIFGILSAKWSQLVALKVFTNV